MTIVLTYTTKEGTQEEVEFDDAAIEIDLYIISKFPISGVKMSNELKEAIWWIAKNKGTWWDRIQE